MMNNLSEIKLKAREILDFTEQLDCFIAADMTLDQSLQKLGEIYQEGNPDQAITQMMRQIQFQVISGSKFSETLQEFPRSFSRFYTSMIAAGELTGNLKDILHHLCSYLKREDDLKNEVKSALTYPIILTILGLGVTIFLLIGVVPRFEQMFRDSGQILPIYTQILLNVSHFLVSFKGLALAIVSGASVYTLQRHIKTEPGRRAFDQWILKVPVLGKLIRQIAVARFTLTLGVLLSSKIELLSALNVSRGVVGNSVIEQAVFRASLRVNAGENMSHSLRQIFPLKAVQMLEIGEANARLAEMSMSVSERYEKEIRSQLAILTSAIEPVLLVVLGAVVCFIALAIFLPMLSQPQF